MNFFKFEIKKDKHIIRRMSSRIKDALSWISMDDESGSDNDLSMEYQSYVADNPIDKEILKITLSLLRIEDLIT